MAATRLFSTLGKLGLGIAVAGGVANTALFNGILCVYSLLYNLYLIYEGIIPDSHFELILTRGWHSS